MFLWFENDCLMKENVFSYFKSIPRQLKNFQNCPKKKLRGDLRTKGGTIGKKFFETCFYDLKMIVLMKENVFSYFESNSKAIFKIFQNWSAKKFKGWPQDQRGDHWKKIFLKHVFMIWKWLFWWKKTFFHIFKQLTRQFKHFQNWPKKNLRGDLRTKGGTIGKKFFETCVFMIWKLLFWWKKTFFHILKAIMKHIQNFSKLVRKKI